MNFPIGASIRRGDKKELSEQQRHPTLTAPKGFPPLVPKRGRGLLVGNETVLRLDADDPEAEEKERARVEAEAAERLARAMGEAQASLQDLLYRRVLTTREFQGLLAQHNQNFIAVLGEVMRRVEQQAMAQAIEQETRQAVERMMTEATEAGVQVGVKQLANVGAEVNYGLINRFALDWAGNYAHDLHDRLNQSTGRQVNEAITAWMESGEHLDALIAALEPTFGRVRAERIAATETTRAFAQGSLVGYRQSGVVTAVEWKTARDSWVCDICRPLHGQRGTLDGRFVHPGGLGKSAQYQGRVFSHPAHVSCRCGIAPIVD